MHNMWHGIIGGKPRDVKAKKKRAQKSSLPILEAVNQSDKTIDVVIIQTDIGLEDTGIYVEDEENTTEVSEATNQVDLPYTTIEEPKIKSEDINSVESAIERKPKLSKKERKRLGLLESLS